MSKKERVKSLYKEDERLKKNRGVLIDLYQRVLGKRPNINWSKPEILMDMDLFTSRNKSLK